MSGQWNEMLRHVQINQSNDEEYEDVGLASDDGVDE